MIYAALTDATRSTLLERERDEARAEAQKAKDDLEHFKLRVGRIGRRQAVKRGWCGEFERICKVIGIPIITFTWRHEVRINSKDYGAQVLQIDTQGSTREEAQSYVSNDEILDYAQATEHGQTWLTQDVLNRSTWGIVSSRRID